LINIPLFSGNSKKNLRGTIFQEDFFGYIEYETNLMNLIQLRRDEIGYHHKKGKLRLQNETFLDFEEIRK